MRSIFLWVIATLIVASTSAFAAGSSINPAIPQANSLLSSAPIRGNFNAAYNDINALIGDNNSPVSPVSPILGQKWLNTSSSTYSYNYWDGSQWVQIGTLNPTAHSWSTQTAIATLGANGISRPDGITISITSGGVLSAVNAGSVTSVGMTVPSFLSVSGSPVTSSGTLAVSLATESANLAFLGPSSGSAAAPTFRSIVPLDLPTGTSVANPGTGTIETVYPRQAVTGASRAFLCSDMFQKTVRSNSGSSMTDTFPASTASCLINGTQLQVANGDASATDVITAGAGTVFITGAGSSSTYTLVAGRDIWFAYDLANTAWRPMANSNVAALTTIANIFTGTTTFGVAGTAAAPIYFANATSGTIEITPPTGALGTVVLTLPDSSSTLATTANINTALPSITTAQLYGGTGGAGVAQAVSIGSGLSLSGGTLSATSGGGSVTSVAISIPNAPFTISGSPVTSSGTLTATPNGTSGGIVCFTATATMASSGALAANAPLIGGGAGACPTGLSVVNSAVLVTNSSGVPSESTTLPNGITYGSGYATGRTYSGTTDSIASTDCNTVVQSTGGSAVTETLPNSIAANCVVAIKQSGAGQITFSAASGATLHSYSCTGIKTAGQYAVVTLSVDSNSGGSSAVWNAAGACS